VKRATLALAAALLAVSGWLLGRPDPSVPTFADVRAAHRPSDISVLDREGAVLHEVRVDATVRRFAWVPLAVIWFGIGMGSVIFVITNTIFFGAIYSTVIGVQTIPKTLHRAVLCHGAKGLQVFTELILPGALVQIILGLRTSMAYGWRALVAGEMIAGSSGLGYMTIEAVQWYQTDTVILGMILIGLLWLMLDRLLFAPLERRTVARWGLLQR